MLFKGLVKFFDRLEDKIRGKLSHHPIAYGFLGGIGVVLFWRGVWHISDEINMSSITSILLGSFILLMTGVFVSAFIGNKLIISGLVGEKKLSEKAKEEIQTEEAQLQNIEEALGRVEDKINALEKEIKES